MDINYELLQYYAYKKIIKRKQIKSIYDECTRLGVPIESYMQAKAYCTEVEALPYWGNSTACPIRKWICSTSINRSSKNSSIHS